jgi:enoyl-CoA hydratase
MMRQMTAQRPPPKIAVSGCICRAGPAILAVATRCERRSRMTTQPSYANILVERQGAVGIVTLNRPQALNALNAALISELGQAFDDLEVDPAIAAIVLTGGDKAFAAGADIKEMADKTYMQAYAEDFITRGWERVAQCRKPVVAAVGGFALGGGCEVAMMCDIIVAADNARFGQPEINLGTMPGAGGTQRLSRFIGKAKAMDLCLTGRMMDAAEAERLGLVSRVVPADKLMEEALAVAERIASLSQPIAMMVKEAVNRAFETTLAEGVRFERRLFHSTFATEDQKEGMAAFIAKRKPAFRNR